MKIPITLKNSYGRLSNRESFLLADNEHFVLEISTEYALNDCIAEFEQGAKVKQHRLKNLNQNGIEIPAEFCIADEPLTIKITALTNGKATRSWTVEPIVFEAVDTGFIGHAEFDDIIARIAALEPLVARVTAVETKLEAIGAELTEIAEIVTDPLE